MDGNEETGMDKVSLNYTVGEASELWTDIFEPIKTDGKVSQQQ
jgi:hypothetical protein